MTTDKCLGYRPRGNRNKSNSRHESNSSTTKIFLAVSGATAAEGSQTLIQHCLAPICQLGRQSPELDLMELSRALAFQAGLAQPELASLKAPPSYSETSETSL